jgi:hypothetical protein
MTSYHVTWEIDLDAETPLEAARDALAIQRDSGSLATVFTVFGEDGSQSRVDITEEDDLEASDRLTSRDR